MESENLIKIIQEIANQPKGQKDFNRLYRAQEEFYKYLDRKRKEAKDAIRKTISKKVDTIS